MQKAKVMQLFRLFACTEDIRPWQDLADAAIRAVDREDRPIVFILWGRPAQQKKILITNPNRLIIESPHPSPLSAYRGFFGSRPFSRTNDWLIEHGETPIDWEIKETL